MVEIEDDEQATKMIEKQGFRKAEQSEIAESQTRKAYLSQMAGYESSVYYQTVNKTPDGYGMSRGHILDELYKLGVVLSESFKDQKVGLLYNYPYGLTSLRTDVKLCFTMFESDKIPEEWPEYLKLAQEVIVPSRWCQKVFKDAGVDTTVVPLGYNDEYFKYVDRKIPKESGEVFTFINYDAFKYRKGFKEIFEAFNEEFKTSENVRLIMKTSNDTTPVPVMKNQYPNIDVVTGNLPQKELADLLSQAHCMVYPSRGEGFGITPLEAMATGLPTIVPNAHGISEYFNPNYMLEVKVGSTCPGLYSRFKNQDVGEMVVCDVKHLRKQMRYAFEHQKEMKELGKAASEYVKTYTYKRTAERLAEIIKKWQGETDIKKGESKYLEVERV